MAVSLAVATAWADEERRGAPPPPEINTPTGEPDRSPSTSPSGKGFVDRVIDTVLGWQRALARKMPGLAAWAVIGSPLLLLVLIVLISAARGRKRGRVRSRTAPQRETSPAAKGGGRKALAPEKAVEVEPLPDLSPVQQLLRLRASGPSLYDVLVTLGCDRTALQGLRQALPLVVDAKGWETLVDEPDGATLASLRRQWVKQVAAIRLNTWLSAHPLVTEAKLQVSMPGVLELSEIEGLAFTAASGLGVSLQPAQQQLLREARGALSAVIESADDPFALHTVAAEMSVPVLLHPQAEEGHDASSIYPLALLLGGLSALSRGVAARLSTPDLGSEFAAAIAEHRELVDTEVPAEGCAVHALHSAGGAKLEGIGTLLAAVAGAAFSSSSVVLRISKLAGAVTDAGTKGALARLGQLVTSVMAGRSGGNDDEVLDTNLRRVLGMARLQQQGPPSAELLRLAERLAREPAIPGLPAALAPDAALVQLHRLTIEHTLQQAAAAHQRMLEIIEKLAYAGQRGENEQIARCRLGYAIAGLGMELVRSGSTELLSSAREAQVAIGD